MLGGKRVGAGRPKGAKDKKKAVMRAAMADAGEMPLEYMLRVMRDPRADYSRRDDMAKSAAKFCHHALASIEHSGKEGAPPVGMTIEWLTAGKPE